MQLPIIMIQACRYIPEPGEWGNLLFKDLCNVFVSLCPYC